MKNTTLKSKIANLTSAKKSNWIEKAKLQRTNQAWLDKSAKIALKVLLTIREKKISQLQLAALMAVSPQQINKIVKGQENLTLETISKLEKALNISLIEIQTYSYAVNYQSAPISNFKASADFILGLKLTNKVTFGVDWVGESKLNIVHNEESFSTGTYGK